MIFNNIFMVKNFKGFVTIKSRLYFSFFLLVFLFIANGVITLTILHNNKQLSNQIATVVDPATHALIEFNQLLTESKMLSTNWVFIRSNKEDKDALIKIHASRYPELHSKLNTLAPQLFDSIVNDSLKNIYVKFDSLIVIQKDIMATLNTFHSYDDPFTRMEMEMKVEDEIIPRTTQLRASMTHIMEAEQSIRSKAHEKLERSSYLLRLILITLACMVTLIGALISFYLVRIITNPIHRLRAIISDMGRGKLKPIKCEGNNNEISLMAASVNGLTENLKASATFATEIGERNFSTDFKPLSEDDTLGKALITMRDNLRETDYRLNQAQSFAKLGSWEFNIQTAEIIWSDELYNMLGYKAMEIKPGLAIFLEHIIEGDRAKIKNVLSKGIQENLFYLECKLLSADNVLKDVYIQGQAEKGEEGFVDRIVGIVQDISVQKMAEAKLQQNNTELIKTNRELDKFVYSVSHDLRAPLSSMLGIVQLTEEDCEDAFIKENLTLVKGSILKLDGFIQDILAYSRNARLDIRKDEIVFKELLTDVTGNLKYMNGKQGHVEVTTIVKQTIPFKSDNSRLSIVLNNLVSNAIRYYNPKEEKPFVNVNVEILEDVAHIKIADNGIGIKKELHSKVFDMFYRVSENSVGSGLGLYIVKETIQKLNGSIEIESEPNRGTTFLITIPNL